MPKFGLKLTLKSNSLLKLRLNLKLRPNLNGSYSEKSSFKPNLRNALK